MKRWFGLTILAPLALGVAALLSGCPVYDGDSGYRVCITGDQCYDCPGSDYSNECVSYRCSSSYDCPGGFVCTGNYCKAQGDQNCTTSAQCPSGQTCGSDRVCRPGDCGTTGCPNGSVCKLSGGKLQCVGNPDAGTPDSGTPPPCDTEGVQDSCAAGSICLHNNCYIGCSTDAGADACKGADKYNICKQVTASTGKYSVCASSANPGNECDEAAGRICQTPNVCIDGYCR